MQLCLCGCPGVIVTAATKEAYASAPTLLRPGGTVVVVGLPAKRSYRPRRSTAYHDGSEKVEHRWFGCWNTQRCRRSLGLYSQRSCTCEYSGLMCDLSILLTSCSQYLTRGKLEDLDEYMKKMQKGELSGTSCSAGGSVDSENSSVERLGHFARCTTPCKCSYGFSCKPTQRFQRSLRISSTCLSPIIQILTFLFQSRILNAVLSSLQRCNSLPKLLSALCISRRGSAVKSFNTSRSHLFLLVGRS